jgi:hypothetical protein
MLTLADFPDTQPDTIPGLAYSIEWHREQEAMERAWLDDYARWGLDLGARVVQD